MFQTQVATNQTQQNVTVLLENHHLRPPLVHNMDLVMRYGSFKIALVTILMPPQASNTPATTLEANIPDQATTQERLVGMSLKTNSSNGISLKTSTSLIESTHNWEEIFKSFFLQFLPTSRAVLNKNS